MVEIFKTQTETLMEMNQEPTEKRQEKKPCEWCHRTTNHTLLHILGGFEFGPVELTGDNEFRLIPEIEYDGEFEFIPPARIEEMEAEGAKITFYKQVWAIWRCDGCNALLLESGMVMREEFETDPISNMDAREYYPAPVQGKRKTAFKHFERIPEKLRSIYEQTRDAYVHKLDILCAMGLRGLIEGICDDKEISGKHDSLEKKIKNLAKLGIPGNIIENLHSFRFMGNTAVHELRAPDASDLHLAIEIVEDILNYLYDLDYKLTALNERQRQKQNPKFLLSEDTPNSD